MGVCDAHGAVWTSERQMSPGEGYLLGARFVQRSVIQDKLIDRDMPLMQAFGMTREQYRLQVESIQGASPWLICEECIGVLKLSQADKNAAREAAKRFWVDKNTPGHVPGAHAKARETKPAYFVIYGNGFTPSEKQAEFIMLAWLNKRKGVLGADAVVGVRADLRHREHAPRMEFVQVVPELQRQHPGQVVDDLLMFDQRAGTDMALVAVWPPEDTAYIQSLLKSEKKRTGRSGGEGREETSPETARILGAIIGVSVVVCLGIVVAFLVIPRGPRSDSTPPAQSAATTISPPTQVLAPPDPTKDGKSRPAEPPQAKGELDEPSKTSEESKTGGPSGRTAPTTTANGASGTPEAVGDGRDAGLAPPGGTKTAGQPEGGDAMKQDEPVEEPPAPARMRIWRDASGEHETKAELIDYRQGKVRLRRTDGSEFTFPLEKLSKADQQYVREEAKSNEQTPAEREATAARRLLTARRHNVQTARRILSEIIAEYPDTKAAREAKSILGRLPGGAGAQ